MHHRCASVRPKNADILRNNIGLMKPTTAKGRLVNLYVYRKYVLNYLKNSPYIHAEMLQMVRMMQPTAEGIPWKSTALPGTPN